MKTFKQFNEKVLHNLFKSIDVKIAKSIYKDLIKNQVLDKSHKFGDEILFADINTHFAHGDSGEHNYRDEIESYNAIVKRK